MMPASGQRRLLCTLLLAAFVATGCWDRVSVDEVVIVLTLGLDAGSEPDTFKVTLEMVNPGGSTSTETGEVGSLPSAVIISREGRTVLEAIQAIQRSVDRTIFLGQLQIVLYGEELARQGIAGTLDHLQRHGQLRRTMNIGVARGSAESVMRSLSETFITLGLSLDALTIQAQRTGFVATLFGDFIQYLVEPGSGAVLPVFDSNEADGSLTVVGTAAFHADRLVGIFNTEESTGVALALGVSGPGLVLVGEADWEGEQVLASFGLRRIRSKVDVRLEDGEPKAAIEVRFEGVLAEQIGGGNFTTERDWSILESMQEQAVVNAIRAAVEKAQEWKVDVFRIGSRLEQRFPHAWKQLEENWRDTFAEMEIEVRVESHLLETGLIKEPLFRKGRDG